VTPQTPLKSEEPHMSLGQGKNRLARRSWLLTSHSRAWHDDERVDTLILHEPD
jgi:hypothetical protein